MRIANIARLCPSSAALVHLRPRHWLGVLPGFAHCHPDSYLTANIEFRNKACIRSKYYSYTEVIFGPFIFIYVYRHIYVRHVLAVALASLP